MAFHTFRKHISLRRSSDESAKSPPRSKNAHAAKNVVYPNVPSLLHLRHPPASSGSGGSSDEDAAMAATPESIGRFVQERVSSLFAKWEPTWWLSNGHLQTFWSSAGDFTDIDHIEYERTLLELTDGGLIAVDFTSPPQTTIRDDTPIVLILAGLTGGAQSSYIRNLLAITSASKDKGGLGYRSIVVNSRGCANVPLKTPQISAGSPDDLRSALLYIKTRYPEAPIFAIGFSLGATVLAKYLGQEGTNSEIDAGCVVACPWNLAKNSEILESHFLHRHVYSKALAKSYLVILNRSLPGLTVAPDSHFASHLDVIRTLRSPTFNTVNTHLTSIIGGPAPHFPHSSLESFYKWASCDDDLLNVRVPLLAINADDDPIVKELPEDQVRENETGNVMLVVTRGGGHLGWFSGTEAKRRWIINGPVVQWVRAFAEDVNWDKQRSGEPGYRRKRTAIVSEEDGFTRDPKDQRPEVGYKIVSEGEYLLGDGVGTLPGALQGL